MVAVADIGDTRDVVERARSRRTTVGNNSEGKVPRFTILDDLPFEVVQIDDAARPGWNADRARFTDTNHHRGAIEAKVSRFRSIEERTTVERCRAFFVPSRKVSASCKQEPLQVGKRSAR